MEAEEAPDGPAPWTRPVVAAVAVLVAAGPLLRSTPAGPLAGIAAVAAVALLAVRRWGRGDRTLYLLLAGAFLARLVVVVADTSLGLFPKADALGYHFRAATLADAWWEGVPWQHQLSRNTFVYELFIAPFYLWFGPSAFLARTVNAAFATAAIFNVFRIGRTLLDRRSALLGTALFAFLPSVVRVHGEHLREAVIILFLTEVLYLLLAGRFSRPGGLALMAGSAVLVFLLRPQTFLVLLAPLVLGVVLWWSRRRRTEGETGATAGKASPMARRTRRLAAAGAGLAVVAGIVLLAGPREVVPTGLLDPARITEVRADWATGGSQYLSGVVFQTWWDVLLFLPVGALYFLFTPFPWQIGTGLALAAAVENLLLFYPVALLALAGMQRGLGEGRKAVLLLFLVLGALMFGLIEGNVGTALRHRAQFTWVLFLFAGPALVACRRPPIMDTETRKDPGGRESTVSGHTG